MPPAWPAALILAGLLLACCGQWFAYSPNVFFPFMYPKLMSLSAGTLLAWIGLAASPRAPQPGRWPLAAPAAACGIVLLLSTLASRDPLVSFLGDPSFGVYGVLQLGLLAALHYGAAAARPSISTRTIIGATVAAAAAVAAYGLAQKAGYELMPGLRLMLPEGRITALQGGPVFLGASLLMALPGALLFLESPRPAQRWLGALAGALVVVALMLTYSRGAWIAAALACAAYGWLRAPAPIRASRAVAACAGVALAAALAWGALTAQRRNIASSDSTRVQFWLAAVRIFARDPMLGSGPDTMDGALGLVKDDAFLRSAGLRLSTNHAHNDLFQALATTGLLGLCAWVWLQWAVFRSARDALQGAERKDAAALAAALIGLFAQMKLNPAPLPSLAIAAVFSALLPREPAPLPRPSAVLAGLSLAVGLSAALLSADGAYLRGLKAQAGGRLADALEEFRAANRLNPASTRYWIGTVDTLYLQSRAETDAGRRRALLDEAAASARRAVAWRPGAAEARTLLGGCLLRLAQAGRPELLAEADGVLSLAASMDLGSRLARERARLVAKLRGQPEREAALAAELSRLQAVSQPGR